MTRRTMLMRAAGAALIAPALLVASVACSDDDGGGDDTGGEPPSLDFLLTPVAGETPTTPSTNLPTAAAPGLMETFIAQLNGGVAATYRVAYDTTTPEGDEGDRYIVYSRPPLARIDIIELGAGEPTERIVSREPDGTVQCSRDGSDWDCVVISLLGDPLVVSAGPVIFPGATDVETGSIEEVAPREIAGTQAQCYDITLGPDGGLEYCLGPEGVPLYASSSLVTAEATEYSVDVTEQDFILPE